MAKSPAIILTERTESSFAVTNSDTILAVLGYATKGPINEVTLVTSKNEFKEIFGEAPANAPWSNLAVYRAFNQGNQVYYTRIADSTADYSEKVIRNDSPATSGYQTFDFLYSIPDGSYDVNTPYKFTTAVDGAAARTVVINSPSGGDWSVTNIASKVNSFLTQNSNGFQEFLLRTGLLIPSLNKEYRIGLAINGTAVAGGNDLSVFLNPSDTLTSIATKLSYSIANGSNGYHIIPHSTITAAGASGILTGTYNIKITVDAGATIDLAVSLVGGLTWETVLERIQQNIAATPALAGKVIVTLKDEEGFKFQSATYGVSSTILLESGLTNDLVAQLTDSSLDAAVDGAAGLTTSAFTAQLNAETLRLRITDTSGVAGTVAITTPDAGDSLITLLGGVGEATTGTAASTATSLVSSNKVKIVSNSTGTSSSILIANIGAAGTGFGNFLAIENVTLNSAVAGVAAVLFSERDNVFITSKEKGSDTSKIKLVKTSSTDPITGLTAYKISVYYNEVIKENFNNVSLTTTDSNYFVTLINADPQNGGSSLISVSVVRAETGAVRFPDGTYYLGKGTLSYPAEGYDYKLGVDGIPSAEVRMSATQLFVAALSTSGDLANAEEYDYHILITPDNGSQAVQDAAIALAEFRADFVYIADPPQGLTYSQAVDWHNGQNGLGREVALNSSYAATYWDWLKDYNENNGEYVWCPPSVFIAELLMRTDRIYAPWYAAAGDVRGRIAASDYASSPSFPQREVLYGDLNCINPIVNFSNKGLEVYGNKTTIRSATDPLNRLHIRRMANFIKKLVRGAMEGMVFEPHNASSWAKATSLINAILEPIRQDNGLDDYRVTIDSSTNTEDLIAQGIMRGIIQLVPVGAIEIIDLTITFLNPGATITE